MFLEILILIVTISLFLFIGTPYNIYQQRIQVNLDRKLFVANILKSSNLIIITISPFNWVILNYPKIRKIYVFVENNLGNCKSNTTPMLLLPDQESIVGITTNITCWPGTIFDMFDTFNRSVNVQSVQLNPPTDENEDEKAPKFTILDAVNQLTDLGIIRPPLKKTE